MDQLFTDIDTHNFTDNDFAIMNFIIENPSFTSHSSLHEFAAKLYLSDTMIVRFCHKIGLSGFNELKYTLKQRHNNIVFDSNFRQQINQKIIEFQNLLQSVPSEQLAEIITILSSKNPLYIHGRSLSSIPARYLHTILSSLDRRCILVEELHLLSSICKTIQTDSIVLIISAKAENSTYNLAFQTAQKRQATTILLTSNQQTSLAKFSDFVLFSQDHTATFNGTDVNSRIQLLTLVQIIIEGISQKII